MTAAELESQYLPFIRQRHSLLLLPADIAIRLLEDSKQAEVQFLGVEAFRMFEDNKIQPAMEFSNICFGTVKEQNGEIEVNMERSLYSGWDKEPYVNVIEKTQAMIRDGMAAGYTWYEVSLLDPETNELLFFREPNN